MATPRAPTSTSSGRWIQKRWRKCASWMEDIGNTYRSTILAQAGLSSGVLLINLLVLIIGTAKYPISQSDGAGSIYAGDCNIVKRANSAAHLTINLLSTTVLSASNYCMQCMVAPSRSEVDKAHNMRRTADIGIQSLKNLRIVPWPRIIVWFLLALSSVPLHLFYNSAVFKTEAGIQYDFLIVQEGFLNQRDLNSTTKGKALSDQISSAMSGWYGGFNIAEQDKPNKAAFDSTMQRFAIEGRKWKNMTTNECLSTYAQDFITQYSTLMLVTKGHQEYVKPMANGTFLFYDSANESPRSYSWICLYMKGGGDTDNVKCNPKSLIQGTKHYNWTFELSRDHFLDEVPDQGGLPGVLDLDIDYCLAEPARQYCELKFSRTILIVVCVMNAFKTLCMLYVAFLGWTDEPMLTVGDAVSSFLQVPDEQTKGLHEWSKRQFRNWKWAGRINLRKMKQSQRRNSRRWIHGASKSKWIVCMLLSAFVLALTGFMLDIAWGSFFYGVAKKDWWGLAYVSLRDVAVNFIGSLRDFIDINQYSMRAGIGNFDPTTRIDGLQWPDSPLWAIVIANIPQLILSFLYLQYNSIFTSMLAESEWTSFGQKPSRLRVTFPRDGQGRTKWLQLPYRWGIPLALLSFTLHWLVSEAIFFAQTTTLLGDVGSSLSKAAQMEAFSSPTDNSLVEARNGRVVGVAQSVVSYSIIGITGSMIVGFIALSVALLIGILKKYPGDLPVGGTCSAVVSASCHGAPEKDSAFRPVRWGDVADADGDSVKGFFNISEEDFTIHREMTRQKTLSWKTMNWIKRKGVWKTSSK